MATYALTISVLGGVPRIAGPYLMTTSSEWTCWIQRVEENKKSPYYIRTTSNGGHNPPKPLRRCMECGEYIPPHHRHDACDPRRTPQVGHTFSWKVCQKTWEEALPEDWASINDDDPRWVIYCRETLYRVTKCERGSVEYTVTYTIGWNIPWTEDNIHAPIWNGDSFSSSMPLSRWRSKWGYDRDFKLVAGTNENVLF